MTQPRKGSAQSQKRAAHPTHEKTGRSSAKEWNWHNALRISICRCLILLVATSNLFGNPDPKPREPSKPDGQILLQRAFAAQAAEDFGTSARNFEEYLAVTADAPDFVHLQYARVLAQLQRKADALRQIESAMAAPTNLEDRIDGVMLLSEMGNLKESLHWALDSLKTYPSDLELNYQAAEIYRVQKNEKQSVVYYTRVLHVAAPGDFRSSYYRGNALWKLALHYVAVKDPELAAAYALQFLQEHPESLGARYLLGAGVYFENGQYNQSLPQLLRLDRVSPAARKEAGIDNARMQFMIGQMLMMRFDPRAIAYFSRCKDKNPLAEQYWLLLTDQSVHSFRPLLDFIRNHPEHLPSRVALLYLLKRNNTKDYAEELINVSELAAAQKQWDTGWKVIQIARDLKTSNPDLPIAWFDIHRLAGLHLTELDQPHRALMQIEKAIEAGDKDQSWKDESDRASFIEQLAALYSNPSIRRMDDARSILQSQLQKMPDRADTYISLGFVEWKDHRLPQALESLKKGQSLQPDRIEYRLVLSMLQSEMGDLKNAQAGYKEVLQQRPNLAPALNSLGYLYTQQGVELENARAMIERAVAEDPANPAYRDSLGWVYFQSGDYLQARFHLEMASSLMQSRGEESPEIYEHLGDVYEKLGMTLAALEAYRNALKVNHGPAKRPEPWITEIQKKIDRIKGNSK